MAKSRDRVQQLFAAIQVSDVEQVQQLLASDVDLNQKDENGQTALTLASSIGNSEVVHLLLAAGATVNPEPDPLVFNPQIVGLDLPGGKNLGDLIAQATANAPEDAKNFYAGFKGLVDAFSSLSTQATGKATEDETTNDEPFADADDSSDMDDEDEGYDEDDDCDDEDGASTPLGAAVLQGDLTTVRTLLQAGADPNPLTWYQTPALVAAARKGDVAIAQALLEAGADANRGFDELPLHTAAEAGHLAMVRLLLDAGAEVEGYEEDEWTALMAASFAGHLPIV